MAVQVFIVIAVGVAFVLCTILWLRLHAILALLGGAIIVDALSRILLGTNPDASSTEQVATHLGRTAGQLTILILMASVIGRCMLQSGAADRIVRATLRLFGVRFAPAAFMSSGFLLGIPVFFDTVFYLMIPLGKALRARTGRNYLLYVLSIVAGATMAHSLVPPTPGPLFVGEQLDVSLGKMILMGSIVGLATLIPGYLYASGANARWDIPLRSTPDLSLEHLNAILDRPETDLPPLSLSLLPVLLPVFLIACGTLLTTHASPGQAFPTPVALVGTLAEKNSALILGALAALAVYLLWARPSRKEAADDLRAAVMGATTIILITAAGGAFGAALRATGIAEVLSVGEGETSWTLLIVAFLITTLIRTAQGSATVAMITAVGVVQSIVAHHTLPFDPVYLALAIGCGSKPFAWMNDSGFWVITTMSGLEEREALKAVTPMTAIMGVFGLAVTVALALTVPWPLGKL